MPSRSRLNATLGGILGSVLHAAAITALAFGNLAYAAAAGAAEPASEPAAQGARFSAAELEELVGPIALYPDELLAIVLPAATYPLQIVQAARFLENKKAEPELEADEEWDASILGLLNYPEVVDLMNQDLNWTWKLGEAVADQQGDVMDAIQLFRAKVDGAGNLESNDKVTVVREQQADQQIIVIESASPEVIYVPSYQPSTVVVHQTAPYPYYYSPPYPYYYSPAATFWTGMFVGAAIGWGLSWGWGHHHSSIHVHRNINVNVQRPTRPSTPNRPGRPDRGSISTRDNWKADRGRGKQSGARPGRDIASRPAAGTRPSAGKQPSAGTRPSAGSGARPQARPAQAGKGAAPSSQRAKAASGRGSSGRAMTSPSTAQRGSKGSSLGSYNKGSTTRAYSSRGHASRGSVSRGGSRGGGGGRGGGGRGGGRRR